MQVQIPVHAAQTGAIEQVLLDAGALSVTLTDSADQPILEPGPGETPIWNEVTVVGLFPGDEPEQALKSSIDAELASLDLAPCSLSLVEDRDWERVWLVDFKPLCFGERLWVCPTGFEVDAGHGVVMELDPGLAFGTGTHPTTALCLEWLAHHALKDMTLIDYGCGSGILGIAALLLGAARVHGVDNDPQALVASRDNCTKNAITADRMPLFLPGDFARAIAEGKIAQADIVLANILAGPLVSLAEYLAAMARPGGMILLSGILREQAQEVMAAYKPWFDMSAPEYREDWSRLEGKRKAVDPGAPG